MDGAMLTLRARTPYGIGHAEFYTKTYRKADYKGKIEEQIESMKRDFSLTFGIDLDKIEVVKQI